MDETTNLKLPYILAAQSQKHVTHNEALRILDAIVQLAVDDKDLATPPGSPVEGVRYIVATSPSGGWTGRAGQIAAYQDGAWAFLQPKAGWQAWVADEGALYVFDGADWVTAGGSAMSMLGINASPDGTNRLAVASPASLFDHEGAGHHLKINKNAPADTGSVLFQTGYSGRAEFGLAGDDDFHVKVSADGSVWHEAIVIDRTTGAVAHPSTPRREVLTANRTYYVRSDGSDSNSGLADTSGGAFATLGKALAVVATIDFNGFTVTIQLRDGTYTGALTVPFTVGQAQASSLIIAGNASTPGNTKVTSPGSTITVPPGARCRLQNFELEATGVALTVQGMAEIHTGMRFGNAGYAMIDAQGSCFVTGNYSVVGSAQRRVSARRNGFYNEEFRTITYVGTPAFSTANVQAQQGGVIASAASTQSGAATGARYSAITNGVVISGGGGANFYPGDVAGSVSTGGQYG